MSRVGLLVDVCAILALGALGVLCAWTHAPLLHSVGAESLRAGRDRRGRGLPLCLAVHAWTLAMVVAPPAASCVCGALYGRRLRLADLGAGEELRSFEQSRRWAWQPRPARRAGERIYLRSQGELVHKRPWPAGVPYVPMSQRRPRRAAVAARRRAAHLRLRCDRLGQDDDDAPRARCADPHAERGAADPRSEGRRGGRTADQPAGGRRGGAVRADRPSRPVERPLPAAVGDAGAGRRAGGRADQAVRALLLRRTPIAPRHGVPRAARRRQVATVDPVPDRRVPSPPLRGARRNRAAPRRPIPTPDPSSRGARTVRVLAKRQRGSVRRRGPAAGRARVGRPRDRDAEDHPGR